MANQAKIPLDIIVIPQKIQRLKRRKRSFSKSTKIHFIPPRFTVHFSWGTPNGIHSEYKVTTFEFPYTGPKGVKREAEKQRGPKKGGILCSVYSQTGSYMGPLALSPAGEGKVAQYLKDRKEFKQLLMAPHSRKSNVHMWVALSFPPDVDEAFLGKFHQIMTDFEKAAE